MDRLTARRVNGIKTGYWSAAKKDDLIQRLGELEDLAERSTKAPAGADEWISPDERLPEEFQRVIIARVYDPGQPLRVEQAIYQPGGWWKVYGTNCRKIEAWRPMPAPPEISDHDPQDR